MRGVAKIVLLALVALPLGASPAPAAPGRRAARAEQAARVDFNGDGFADLAVGAPGEGIGAAFAAGAVNVLYGSAAGLQPSADVFYQGPGGAGGVPEDHDRFGAAVARGDFDGDGFFDLAVGAPSEAVGTATAAGAISVLNGSSGGLTGGELFTQANAEDGDEFGSALAAGDFDGDGIFDLAVGAPGEDVGAAIRTGAVTVLFGSDAGLTTTGSQTLFQGAGGVAGTAEHGDSFGSSLATGLLAGDDLADLVVGVPFEDVGATGNAGAVNVLAGSAAGLVNGSLLTQGNPEELDAFGSAVTTGDFDATAGDDIAAGAPSETVNGVFFAGAVSIFNGPPSGLGNERLLYQGTAGIPGTPESFDQFGAAVAPTDTNGIGQWDLAVGVPGEDIGPDADAGAVNLLAGSATGPSGGSLVLQGNPEDSDRFGEAIAGGFFLHDFDNNGFHDLAVGAPAETVGAVGGAGAVSVFYASGGPGGTVAPGPAFTQGPGGLGGVVEGGETLGSALE
jgi:FG-GAP repeat